MKRFTLIELLVVIGIIAVLAAMLLPALSKAREKSVASDCLNNMKQLSTAMVMYENDNENYFPIIGEGTAGVNQDGQWIYYTGYPVPKKGVFIPSRGTLYTYAPNNNLYVCKADTSGGHNSYSLNSNANDAKITEVDNPSETPILLEEGQRNESQKKYRTSNDGFYNAYAELCDIPADRHNQGSNYSCMDGHAVWIKRSWQETKQLCTLERED